MSTDPLEQWLRDGESPGTVWFAKRLAAGDTAALTSHQRGPALPRELVVSLFGGAGAKKSSVDVTVSVDSHGLSQRGVVNWYDLKTFGGLRQETRLTNLRFSSPVTSPRSSGALGVFVFRAGSDLVRVWICRDAADENAVCQVLGHVEPGWDVTWQSGEGAPQRRPRSPAVEPRAVPDGWRQKRPSTREILGHARTLTNPASLDVTFLELRTAALELLELTATGRRGPDGSDHCHRARDLLRLQLQSDLGADVGENWPPEGTTAAAGGSRRRLMCVDAFAGDSWAVLAPKLTRGSCLLTLQEGLDAETCNAITDAGISLVVPEPLQARYPVGVRRQLVTLDQLRSGQAPAGTA